MRVKFLTFGEGHLVSDKEFSRLAKGFAKVGMELVRDAEDYDILMVKGFSHTYQQAQEKNPLGRPLVYFSIGSEWKLNATPEMNDPIRELYEKADFTVHNSSASMQSHHKVFPRIQGKREVVIIPAEEPKLGAFHEMHEPLKMALTCIPRPVKRVDQIEELCKKYNIELVPAWGSVSDFSYYHDCDGYLHLSRKEGMPNTVLEALSYGLPCIVTNYGGAHEAVGDAGIVINNDPIDVPWDPDHIESIDEELFVDAVKQFRERYRELKMKVRSRVLSQLNDYICACQFQEVFESLLK